MELEQIALEDEYFVERRLYPNVDFYSWVIYTAIGTPENMFTPNFAIGRPRQIFTGKTERPYVTIDRR